MAPVRASGRRERVRAATIDEIKRTALALMHEQGITNVRFTDIARAMGMTPPALYRYFVDRDDLLTALIADGYDSLGRSVAEAYQTVEAGDLAGRWRAGALAYRDWAKREPQRFALVFGLPVPGYAAPAQGVTTEAARRAMGQLAALFVEARQRGQLRPPLVRDTDPALEVCALAKNKELPASLAPESFQAMLHAWSALHGFVCLEAYGHLDWMAPAARDALFEAQLTLSAEAAGFPVPQRG